ncbi:fasciclin domain-containing protein [Marinobacter sp. LV10R510-11A]|uniref:fasciclin domain-containing protein n=1 Tax=Marinobacter sp. LV10R510-11A TaxID=1415568 RepID=UPI000BB992D7|nr:fasciclin domain-containing protein [Marinobacter sp. LV10R510-11A]
MRRAKSAGVVDQKTDQGGQLKLSTKGGTLMIEDSQGNMAKVIQADVMQSNGVVHVIDTVLMPGM